MTELTALTSDIAANLKRRGETIAVAESSTGGLISATLLAVPGASAYYLGGTVVYTIEARRALLNIPDETLRGMTPLSEDYVRLCARSMREQMGATWAIAELGATGPAGTRYGHPPGICVLAVEGPACRTTRLETGHGDREKNMWEFARTAFSLLDEAMAATD